MKRIATAAVLILFVLPAWADYQDGMDAAERGDYATALKEWRPLANKGDAQAQVMLGGMYGAGWGVAKDDAEAVRWYRLAADQGYARAQALLGDMYLYGDGVPQNYVQAYMWSNLAAEQGQEFARANRDTIAGFMTPSQIEEAQRLAREWFAAHP
jgi:uncharacterized protein